MPRWWLWLPVWRKEYKMQVGISSSALRHCNCWRMDLSVCVRVVCVCCLPNMLCWLRDCVLVCALTVGFSLVWVNVCCLNAMLVLYCACVKTMKHITFRVFILFSFQHRTIVLYTEDHIHFKASKHKLKISNRIKKAKHWNSRCMFRIDCLCMLFLIWSFFGWNMHIWMMKIWIVYWFFSMSAFLVLVFGKWIKALNCFAKRMYTL